MSRYKNYLMLGVATLAAIVMRTVMAFFIIDQKSGFVNSEAIAYAVFIVIVLLAAAAVVYLQAFIGPIQKLAAPDFSGGFRIISSAILSLVIVLDALKMQTNYLLPSWQINLYIMMACVFALYLILSAFPNLNKNMPELLTVIPVAFWLCRLVMVFTVFSSVSNTVDNIFELLTLCTILLFHLTYAKAVCLEPTVKLLRRLNAVAYLSCYMAFITAVPRMIIVCLGYESILHQNNKTFGVIFWVGLYILVFILKNNKKV